MTQMHALPDSRDTSARPSVHLVSGDLFGEGSHAVKWQNGQMMGGIVQFWSKWHWTTNSERTLCGAIIPVAGQWRRMLPVTDERQEKVECKHCLRRLNASSPNMKAQP